MDNSEKPFIWIFWNFGQSWELNVEKSFDIWHIKVIQTSRRCFIFSYEAELSPLFLCYYFFKFSNSVLHDSIFCMRVKFYAFLHNKSSHFTYLPLKKNKIWSSNNFMLISGFFVFNDENCYGSFKFNKFLLHHLVGANQRLFQLQFFCF